MRYQTLLLLGSLFVAAGCGSAVGRGTALYRQQNYIEAAEVFERTQNRLATMDLADRARYGLYRGLTLMALGDLRGGERWLDYAEAQQRAQPGLLQEGERALLTRGRIELTQQLQASWPKPEPHWTQSVAATTNASGDESFRHP
jgi:hypothetical protein